MSQPQQARLGLFTQSMSACMGIPTGAGEIAFYARYLYAQALLAIGFLFLPCSRYHAQRGIVFTLGEETGDYLLNMQCRDHMFAKQVKDPCCRYKAQWTRFSGKQIMHARHKHNIA